MKNLFFAVVLLPLASLAQNIQTRNPIVIDGGTGANTAISIVSSNQAVPFIRANDTTNTIFSINQDGSFSTRATTNQITFGGTNNAPVSVSTNVTTWVSVHVAGFTNEFRLPLYK